MAGQETPADTAETVEGDGIRQAYAPWRTGLSSYRRGCIVKHQLMVSSGHEQAAVNRNLLVLSDGLIRSHGDFLHFFLFPWWCGADTLGPKWKGC